jgi:hypothetical protein
MRSGCCECVGGAGQHHAGGAAASACTGLAQHGGAQAQTSLAPAAQTVEAPAMITMHKNNRLDARVCYCAHAAVYHHPVLT